MSVSERLKYLCEKEGSLTKFSKKTGIERSAISRIITKGTGIRSQTLTLIAEAYPELNIRWLMTGEGDMWLTDKNGLSKEDKIREEFEQVMAENEKMKKEIFQLMKDKELNQEQIKKLWDLIEEYRKKI